MKDYIKRSLRENPDHFISHFGTNNLGLDRSPELIAKSVIDLPLTFKNESHELRILNIIIIQNDNDNLNVALEELRKKLDYCNHLRRKNGLQKKKNPKSIRNENSSKLIFAI